MVRYIPQNLVSQPFGFCYCVKSPYKAAFYNFKVSLSSRDSDVQKIANPSFKKRNDTVFQKTKHFFKHIGVGSLLMIPLFNIFLLIGLLPKKNTKAKVKEPTIHSKLIEETIPIPFSPVKSARAAFQANREQELKDKLDSLVLDGKRTGQFSFAESYAQTKEMTKTFFHYFPEETKAPQFISLKKKKGEEDLAPLCDDIKFVEDLIIALGVTAEQRLRYANANFPSFINFLNQKFPELKGEFYLCGNYKNEIKDKARNIPYLEIIKDLFLSENDKFISLMQSYHYEVRTGPKDERTPIQINKRAL